MKVSDVAAKTGVSPHAIRHYVRVGLLRPTRQTGNRYRRFTDTDLNYLSFIRKAQTLGFTLGEIRKIFEKSRTGKAPCPIVREIIERRIADNLKELKAVMALQRDMELALEQWRKMPDRAPDGDSICHLIETHARRAA